MMAELVCGTQDRDAWLAARRQGITATDLPVILGLVTWDSPFALYWRKKGVLPEVVASDRMRLGSWLEDQIASEWAVREAGSYWPGGLYRNYFRQWQLATPDRIIYIPSRGEIPAAVLECKTSATRDGWGSGEQTSEHGPGDEICEECSTVPAHVRAQVLWQMDTLDVATGHVAVVFLPSGEFRSYTIRHSSCRPGAASVATGAHDCPACRDIALMRAKAEEFWDRLNDGAPPPVDGLQVTTDALRFLHAGAVRGKQAEIPSTLAIEYEMACEDERDAKIEKRQLENKIRALIGDATDIRDSHGCKIARREVFKRAGYEVGPAEVDRLVRVKPREDKADEH